MATSTLFGLFNLAGAIALCILIARARKNRQLRITLITSGPMTKVEKIVLKGNGLTIAMLGWGISAILFSFSGLNALLSQADSGVSFFVSFISAVLAIFIMPIASYFTPNSKE